MIQWMNPGTRRACLFAALLAALAGCNDGGDNARAPPESTFAIAEPVDDTKVPEEPVVGVVTEVPDTKHDPVIEGGEAVPLTEGTTPAANGDAPPDSGTAELAASDQIVVEPAPVPLPPHIDPPAPDAQGMEERAVVVFKASRFTEIAPDATGGATFAASSALEYNLGNLVAMNSADSAGFTDGTAFVTPVKGWLRFPEKALNTPVEAERFPIIIFLHGMHTWFEPSYKGYDYLARDLAEHGYVTMSIDANLINSTNGFDNSGKSRAQLVLGMLDRLRQIDGFGQIDMGGNVGKLDPLQGKLDFDRIGIMGHSRGGQGIANTILFNETRSGVTEEDLKAAVKAAPPVREWWMTTDPTDPLASYPDLRAAVKVTGGTRTLDEAKFKAAVKKYNLFYAAGSGNNTVPLYNFKGAFLLAPTDFGGNRGLSNVPLATLLPSCDGDMSNLHGASTFDRNRFGRAVDTAPRYQIMVNGANHNDYNTEWTNDDFASARGPLYCTRGRADSIRLTAENQRRGGLFIMNSFMRYHVGGEQKFAAYWNGFAQLPGAACPAGKGPCDERMVLTVQKDDNRRKLIQRFEWVDSLKRSELGGATTFSGFDAAARCDMPSVSGAGGNCLPKRLPGFEYLDWVGTGLLSIADHAELAWSKPDASIVIDLKDLPAESYDSLTFRIAVVRPMGQEVMVTLTDSAGWSQTIRASDFSDALYNAPRRKKGGSVSADKDLSMVDDAKDKDYSSGQVKMLMNMVAIPLDVFWVDKASLKELKLTFPKASGKVAITDIELQNLGRPSSWKKVASTEPNKPLPN